jgi:hypothetical protein
MWLLFIIAMIADALSPDQLRARLQVGALARTNLVAFAALNTPDPLDPSNHRLSKYQWRHHHALIASELQKLESGEVKALEIVTPPRYGKSEMAVRNFVVWHAGRHPDRDLLVITATSDLAVEHGRDCRDYFNGPGYNLTFGADPRCRLRSDSQSAERLQLAGGAKIQFYGRGGIPAGVGGFGIVFDDFFKSAEEAYSAAERDKAWRSYVADCLSRLNNANAWKLVIGSRKHEDDVQGRLFDPTNQHYDKATAESFTRIHIPALSLGSEVDALGREKDEVCWPERFPKEFYLAKRNHPSDIVRADFQTQDQGQPRTEEGTWFKKTWLKTYKLADLPRNLRYYVASDHAYRIGEKNDYSCLLVVGIDPTGAVYVLPQTVWEKCDTEKLADHIFKLIVQLRPAQWWAARDAISGSILPFLRRRMLDEKVFFYIDDTMTEKKDLVARSASIRGLMAMGMVHWPSEWPQWSEAENQLLSFPGKRDDLIAALAMLGMGMDKMIAAPSPAGPGVVKGSYAWHSREKKSERPVTC